jgi:hypothetical protein
MKKMSWIDRVKNEVLHGVKKGRNTLYALEERRLAEFVRNAS